MQHNIEERNRAKSATSNSGRYNQVQNGYKESNPQHTLDGKYSASSTNRGRNTHTVGLMHQQKQRSVSSEPISEKDIERMKRTIKSLQDQLSTAEDTIRNFKLKERELNERIAQQMENKVQLSGKFENLSQKSIRPTHIIEKFGLLYTQDRIDAMDELDQIIGLSKYGKHQEMKQKILYGVIIASYKVSHDYLEQLKSNIHRLLGIPHNYTSRSGDHYAEAVTFLSKYLQATTQTFNIEPIVTDVQDQLTQLLPEFPILSRLPGNASYIEQCCYITWAMVNQIPPMEIEHSQDKFSGTYHTRFHSSSDKNTKIKMYIWPTLIDSISKDVLYKGVVWT